MDNASDLLTVVTERETCILHCTMHVETSYGIKVLVRLLHLHYTKLFLKHDTVYQYWTVFNIDSSLYYRL